MRAALLVSFMLCAPLSGAQENPFVIVDAKSLPKRKPVLSPLMKRVMAVKPNRPADRAAAVLLVRAYFEYHLGGCGAESEPIDKGRHWLFTTQVGFAGSPGPDIFVDKRTGTTSAKGLPTVKDPKAYYGKPRKDPWWLEQMMKRP